MEVRITVDGGFQLPDVELTINTHSIGDREARETDANYVGRLIDAAAARAKAVYA